MMTRLFLFAGLALLLVLSGCASRPADRAAVAESENSQYQVLRERLRNGDWEVDAEQLRNAYVLTELYQPYAGETSDALRSIAALAKGGRFEECFKAVQAIKEKAFPLLVLHHFGWYCANESDNPVDAAEHERMARKIHEGIVAPGDGKTTATAWRVLSTDELYLVLAIQGLQPKSQALVQADGKAFDRMTVVRKDDGSEETRYFDITRQMVHGMGFLDE